MHTINIYCIKTGLITCTLWCILLLVGFIYFVSTEKEINILYFGPSEDIVFICFKINTWNRWTIVMMYSLFSQIIYTIISNTLRPYIKNVIQDHKTSNNDKPKKYIAHYINQIYTFYNWISHIFDIFLYLTIQIQFIIPSFLVDIVMTYYYTENYMKIKEELPLFND